MRSSAGTLDVSCVTLPQRTLAAQLPSKRTGEALGLRALVADAWETFVCAYLSSTLLLGLALDALAG